MKVDKETIQSLAEILDQTGLTEIEISEKDSKIRVAKMPAPVAAVAPQVMSQKESQSVSKETVVSQNADEDHPGIVPSPMVGIVYLTPDPASPPFFKEGEQVAEGQTILLIEAMKTFNQIKAPRSGKIVRYLVNSGEPVEYGAPLAIIE